MHEIELHPEVHPELENSRAWYERHSNKLADRFLKEIDFAIDRILKSPQAWPVYSKQESIHRYFLRRFPYAIIYRVLPDTIQILAVSHESRRPDYWQRRLGNQG